MDLNNDTFLATFGNDQDYLRALTGGPWVILDHYLIVHQWSPSFRPSDKPHKSVVAWVQLPELPVHFYHREVLFALGNLIGRTIKLDYHTERLERGKFARIAVDLDMTRPLPTRIWLDGIWQAVVYENLPTICYDCGRIRHSEEHCPEKKPSNSLAMIPILDPDQQHSPPAEVASEPPAGFGPWMQVSRKSRKPKQKAVSKAGNQADSTMKGVVESGRGSGKPTSKGKADIAKITSAKEEKGKVVLRPASNNGSTSNQKGKMIMKDMKTANGKVTEEDAKEWRPVGLKGNPSSNGKLLASQPSNDKEASPSSSKNTISQPVTQTVLGPNNTKIHIVAVPPLVTNQKENSDPKSRSSSAREHFTKKGNNKNQNQEKHRGINLKAVKKPIQINSSGMLEMSKQRKGSTFPITIKDIEGFFATSPPVTDGKSRNDDESIKDVMMAEEACAQMTTANPELAPPQAPALSPQ
ncbi:unnamed protein product [Linum tenue]|uniref:CCHC-type domain-containing protein n=1 Tax=Linum tenue TaxID=586396 RepID=A0AAV0R0W4_9ROSI|nr:unnamed protein product [Linum tenue]